MGIEIAAYITVMEGDVNLSRIQRDLLGLLEPVAKSILAVLLVAYIDVRITIVTAVLTIKDKIPIQIAAVIHRDGHSAYPVAFG